MNSYKKVLTIAGSDSGGGAGIQADIKTISALGCYATTAITAITVQNTVGVSDVLPIPSNIVREQIKAVLDDIGTDAVKIGMLGSKEIAQTVAETLKTYNPRNIVLDPVLVATSGDQLSQNDTVEIILNQLMPMATVVTPNMIEATKLSGITATDENYDEIWNFFQTRGAKALLLKGGHAPNNNTVTDILYTPQNTYRYTAQWIDTPNTHGTGCTLSSAIAAYMAHGMTLNEAVEQATAYIHHAIATAREYKLGQGHGPVYHFFKYW